MALGIAANSKKLQGTMRVDSIGIRLENDSGIMLSNTKIDETGISKTMETLAVVQSKIANENTYLEPHVLSVKRTLSLSSLRIVRGLYLMSSESSWVVR